MDHIFFFIHIEEILLFGPGNLDIKVLVRKWKAVRFIIYVRVQDFQHVVNIKCSCACLHALARLCVLHILQVLQHIIE